MKEIQAEEEKLINLTSVWSWQKRERYSHYYYLSDGVIYFKMLEYIQHPHNGEPTRGPNAVMWVGRASKVQEFDLKIIKNWERLIRPKPTYIDSFVFKKLHIIPSSKWDKLLHLYKKTAGLLKPKVTFNDTTKVDYKQYLRKRKWRLSRFIFYLAIYRQHRQKKHSIKRLAEYYCLSKHQIDRIIGQMFYIHCEMKSCYLLPLMRTK